jgi:hypothetical protein
MDSADQSAEEDILLLCLEIAIKLPIHLGRSKWPEWLQGTLRKF